MMPSDHLAKPPRRVRAAHGVSSPLEPLQVSSAADSLTTAGPVVGSTPDFIGNTAALYGIFPRSPARAAHSGDSSSVRSSGGDKGAASAGARLFLHPDNQSSSDLLQRHTSAQPAVAQAPEQDEAEFQPQASHRLSRNISVQQHPHQRSHRAGSRSSAAGSLTPLAAAAARRRRLSRRAVWGPLTPVLYSWQL